MSDTKTLIELGEPAPPLLPEDAEVMQALTKRACAATPEERATYARALSAVRRQQFAAIADPPSDEARQIAAQITADGVADMGKLLDAAQVADIVAYLRPRPVYGAHVAGKSDGVGHDLEALGASAHYGAYAPADIARCPHLVEIANDRRLLQIAEAYLGCPPTLYNLNVWWSFARGTPASQSQILHRDLDDLRFVTLFIYLTDVDERNGPHLYIKCSHDKAAFVQALAATGRPRDEILALVLSLFRGQVYQSDASVDAALAPLELRWQGPAGSALMADTYGVHMGIPVVAGERLMAWVRYGVGHSSICFNGGHGDVIRPRIPQTDRARYVNRLLLRD